jgi:lipoate---protein ligase
MKYLDLTLDTPEANVALDEALLDFCEEGRSSGMLRFWECPQLFVVVGYGNEVAREVRVEVCQRRNVPVLRRCTGGGAVVQGTGCLNYALVLEIERAAELSSVTGTNRFVMEKHRDLFRRLWHPDIEVRGHTDLALSDRKFSGNAQRRRRRFLLFHGTFLLGFDLSCIEELLPMPSRQPGYRSSRPHSDFLLSLDLPLGRVKRGLQEVWGAREAQVEMPWSRVERLLKEKYSSKEWNLRT